VPGREAAVLALQLKEVGSHGLRGTNLQVETLGQTLGIGTTGAARQGRLADRQKA